MYLYCTKSLFKHHIIMLGLYDDSKGRRCGLSEAVRHAPERRTLPALVGSARPSSSMSGGYCRHWQARRVPRLPRVVKTCCHWLAVGVPRLLCAVDTGVQGTSLPERRTLPLLTSRAHPSSPLINGYSHHWRAEGVRVFPERWTPVCRARLS